MRPVGNPIAPVMSRCRPGLSLAIPGQAPPTARERKAPNAMWVPATMPSLKIFPNDPLALDMPASTAPSYKAGGDLSAETGAPEDMVNAGDFRV